MSLETSQGSCSRPGLLLVVSGPSGAGKSTVCHEVLARLGEEGIWSISATTRPPRGQECDGHDYHFVSRERFEQMIARDELLEWAEYLGNLYGTPRRPVEMAMNAGQVMVLEIDVQGGCQVAQRLPQSVRVFLLPPDDQELARRLIGRKTETAEQQARRLAKAHQEIEAARQTGCYPYFVTNHTIEETVRDILRIVEVEREKECTRISRATR